MINIPRIFSSFFALNLNKFHMGKYLVKTQATQGMKKVLKVDFYCQAKNVTFSFFEYVKVWRGKKYLCENKERKKFLKCLCSLFLQSVKLKIKVAKFQKVLLFGSNLQKRVPNHDPWHSPEHLLFLNVMMRVVIWHPFLEI